MNIANFKNIYTNIHSYIICGEKDSKKKKKKKNDSINSLLQHGRVANNNCCVVFPASRFPYLILCPR